MTNDGQRQPSDSLLAGRCQDVAVGVGNDLLSVLWLTTKVRKQGVDDAVCVQATRGRTEGVRMPLMDVKIGAVVPRVQK